MPYLKMQMLPKCSLNSSFPFRAIPERNWQTLLFSWATLGSKTLNTKISFLLTVCA